MVQTLFPRFLEDMADYECSERYWRDLWDQLDCAAREEFGWRVPWIGTGSPTIKDGNPIFSAWSPPSRRGIRIIQEEPIHAGLDFRMWLDTFGGDITDPDCIHELVISCVLSNASASIARNLMELWVRGQPVTFQTDEAGRLRPSRSPRTARAWEFAA